MGSPLCLQPDRRAFTVWQDEHGVSTGCKVTTLVLANGPFGLLTAAVLARHLECAARRVRVFHYATTPRVIETERWLAAGFAYAHGGLWPDLERMFRGASGSIAALREVVTTRLALDPSTVTRMILPYHPTLADILTLALFPQADIHFYAEGLLLGFPDDLAPPAEPGWIGLPNPFAKNAAPPIWSAGRLSEAMRRFGEPRLLPADLWRSLLVEIAARPEFAARAAAIRRRAGDRPISCLLLQPLADLPGWIDYADEMMLWATICGHEIAGGGMFLLVKPHPSDHPGKLVLLARLLGDRLGEDAMLLAQEPLSALPLEVFAAALPIRRVAGLCSTSLLTFTDPRIETRPYLGPPAAGPLAAQIHEVARRLNRAPVALDAPAGGVPCAR